jgi:hypothetical protein
MIPRRTFLAAAAGSLAAAQSPSIFNRLDQGPFEIDQDEGWLTVHTTTPWHGRLRNPGLGLVGYTWEEAGPSLAARAGNETLQQHVDRMAALPFIDVLYIRCDWRHVQSEPGKLNLQPIWRLTLDAARQRGLRIAFRVQLSNPNSPGGLLALPDFVKDRVPMVTIGKGKTPSLEPRYDHPAFQSAFRELNQLLAAEFDGHPSLEWVDLCQYGFWGEGHTANLGNPFPDFATAERTMVAMTEMQLAAWRRTPLAVNTQPDISHVGNRRVIDLATKAGAWLRSDSILIEEPIQIEMLSNRPPWLAAILEDGYDRTYEASRTPRLVQAIRHALDAGSNYWALWTESANLAKFFEAQPELLSELQSRLGYRVRPSWVWQRKRHGAYELVVAVANDGVAGVPGVLNLELHADGGFRATGSLDKGHPNAGRLRQCAFTLPRELEGRKVSLHAELEIRPGVRRPVQWAVNPDEGVTFDLLRWNDPRWRKDI